MTKPHGGPHLSQMDQLTPAPDWVIRPLLNQLLTRGSRCPLGQAWINRRRQKHVGVSPNVPQPFACLYVQMKDMAQSQAFPL